MSSTSITIIYKPRLSIGREISNSFATSTKRCLKVTSVGGQLATFHFSFYCLAPLVDLFKSNVSAYFKRDGSLVVKIFDIRMTLYQLDNQITDDLINVLNNKQENRLFFTGCYVLLNPRKYVLLDNNTVSYEVKKLLVCINVTCRKYSKNFRQSTFTRKLTEDDRDSTLFKQEHNIQPNRL